VARKASDLVMLLRSRGSGRGRSKSGFLSRTLSGLGLSGLGSGLVRLLGGSPRKSRREARSAGSLVPGWIALAVALICFGGGYVVRGYLDPATKDAGGAGLKSGPRAPGLIEADTEPLASQGFFVAAYVEMPVVEAKRRAIELSRYLQKQGLEKARPYEYPGPKGRFWVVIVYCDGRADREDTAAKLRALPEDVPDPVFVGVRNRERNLETGWPNVYPVQ